MTRPDQHLHLGHPGKDLADNIRSIDKLSCKRVSLLHTYHNNYHDYHSGTGY